jgi:hypothetical protein
MVLFRIHTVSKAPAPPQPFFPAAGGSYLLDPKTGEWVLRDESAPPSAADAPQTHPQSED